MLFNSLPFLVFFPCVLAVYFMIPKKLRGLWLLAASYFFYMCWEPLYIILLLVSTATTYIAGLLLQHFDKRKTAKKLVVCGNLLINLAILFLFKYYDFFMDTLIKISGRLHINFHRSELHFLLPVGISFYIFQAVGYTIDVYRQTIRAELSFWKYALFVSFFPQLVAGPIERSGHFMQQLDNLENIKLFDSRRIQQGAVIMLYGYILKMILADRASLYVDTVFNIASYGSYRGITVLVAVFLFTLQIYCDFAGYTYIAIGAAKIMGFELITNFNTPYFALSIKDFWSRWHISLTSWFRDYLYIPLGGSRKGRLRKYANIILVFLLSGLWHGAAWHYVIWGGLHGLMRVFGETTQALRDELWKRIGVRMEVFSFRLWRRLFTFAEVALAWTFFRASSTRQAIDLIRNGLGVWNPWVLFDGTLLELGLDGKDWNVLILALAILLIVDVFQYKGKDLAERFVEQNLLFKWLIFYIGIFAIITYGIYGADYNAAQFIYFQF